MGVRLGFWPSESNVGAHDAKWNASSTVRDPERNFK